MFLLPFISAIPLKAFVDAKTRLNSFFEHFATKNEKRSEERAPQGRYSWTRKGRALIIYEEVLTTADELTRRESAKFEFENGIWHLYCMDASGRWRRYILAQENENFDLVFRHWVADETGVFR